MRIRFKPWARPELEASKFYIDNPESYKCKWQELFNNNNPIHLELGCGKGGFISKISVKNPDINYIAIDLVDAMLGLAKRKVEEEYNQNNKEINNIYLTRYDIERIANIFGRDDKIERIYINFCNPWPRGKHHKKRLTHTCASSYWSALPTSLTHRSSRMERPSVQQWCFSIWRMRA